MEVLFVVPSFSPHLLQECRGTLALAWILRTNGISADLLRYWQADPQLDDFAKLVNNLVRCIEEVSPRIVSFYCRCDIYHIVLSTAKEIKMHRPDITILFGGPQSDISAEETLQSFPFVDFVCCGEGETTISSLVRSILSGYPDTSVEGLAFISGDGTIIRNRPPRFIHDNYKVDYNYYNLIPRSVIERSGQTMVEVGRGCPFNCSFCSSKTFWKRRFRLRDIDDIIGEVRYVYETFGIQSVRFEHDIFTADNQRIRKFCEKLLESGIPISWSCSSRADTADNETILLMKQAGLRGIYFGIETGSKRMQDAIHKRLDLGKAKTLLQSCVDMGVEVTASFMYGFPQETEEDASNTLNLVCDLLDMGIERVQAHLVDFLQGTELFEKFKDELVFDGRVSNIATRFGISECDFIPAHRDIFSAFFDYPSELRTILDVVEDFIRCYMKFRSCMQQLRTLMGGDAMKLYRSFKLVAEERNKNGTWKGDRAVQLCVRKGRDFRGTDIETVRKLCSQFGGDLMVDKFEREVALSNNSNGQ